MFENDSQFVYIAQLDTADDLYKKENWIKANPILEYDEDALENLVPIANTARDMGGEDLRDFLVKQLNMWMQWSNALYIKDIKDWKRCAALRTLKDFRGSKCYVGVDLSSGGDLTSIAIVIPYMVDGVKKVSKILSTILLITMVLYVVFGLTQIKQPIFQFSGDKMFTGGFKGFMLAALLLINSANGYYNILWYGKDAKKATKDVPFASMACVPCLLFIYVGLAMVTGGVLPHDEVAGAPTILPAAQAILPGAVYKIFMIGGPIMAIITTLNGVFNDVRYPLAQAAKDGWLPKFILKENRFGAPYLIYTYTLIVVLIPIVTDMSIVTITNIFQVITFFMNVTVVYAISRLPKRYPEAWAKNKFHFSNGALYTFCTVSIIIYTVIFVKGIFSIKVSYAVAAVIVMLALILIGIYLTKKGGIRIETSLWDPSVKKEEK